MNNAVSNTTHHASNPAREVDGKEEDLPLTVHHQSAVVSAEPIAHPDGQNTVVTSHHDAAFGD